jgi:hypothetical protein
VWWQLPHVFHVFSWVPEAKLGVREVADFLLERSVHRRAVIAPPLAPAITAAPEPAFAPAATLAQPTAPSAGNAVAGTGSQAI